MDVVQPALSMPAPGAGVSTIYPSRASATPQPAGPYSGNAGGDVEFHAFVAASMQSQLAYFSGAVQKNITGVLVKLVQNSMGPASGGTGQEG